MFSSSGLQTAHVVVFSSSGLQTAHVVVFSSSGSQTAHVVVFISSGLQTAHVVVCRRPFMDPGYSMWHVMLLYPASCALLLYPADPCYPCITEILMHHVSQHN